MGKGTISRESRKMLCDVCQVRVFAIPHSPRTSKATVTERWALGVHKPAPGERGFVGEASGRIIAGAVKPLVAAKTKAKRVAR